jgi:hypothetical protein
VIFHAYGPEVEWPGTKYFVVHDQGIARRIENQDRHHAARARWSGKFVDVQYLGASGVSICHQWLQSCEMHVIYDRRVVDRVETVRIHATGSGTALFRELTLAFRGH